MLKKKLQVCEIAKKKGKHIKSLENFTSWPTWHWHWRRGGEEVKGKQQKNNTDNNENGK